ncbi:hypothetical protein A3I99_02625 [Candidatus Kaiserbacteria bacterium RIFCSPLOWO2_02_FULL_45_11b]|uniref:Uncharacterized protein n=1 Tax=Candidatus Kaiserbacteria bacterium RIFCSPLOWO2_12_FULL_45_26 TaxID=1798525 RepID=A0A1F6FFB9_9BACT|nr:MAG: hypothetical protein A2Z56_01815 [Candidatus Kaiserbacteria bacterium RIFCSPHIGHO2_12_45_16]OGG70280.1 MAG: hypothetical protein A2929_04370 [Candidatus Kaiserbacteria bacterium RIFCSPLOWO2_01_FULL_45_25]OGG81948.1 MAG: hypothetical protein A3I99_02625 [Candidatus Kaiserbacteria bacterium RIFCSPLOWO2_02_FULL_45_11b]OGG84544.1 MAG: hypothetical protein A3G90_00415 [Candidatus Kaiserbacteria bacterium RIFCSPLOWO2_12_FULL_45_26]
MTAQKYLVALFLVLTIFGGFGSDAQAASVSEGKIRAELLSQIELLLKEVQRLQAIIAERESAKYTLYTPYTSVYFPLDFETMYLVRDGELYAIGSEDSFENSDVHLFELFKGIVGQEAVDTYVREWRVFENKSNDLGAFVELIAGTEDWIVGVNRESFDINDSSTVKSFANLFVHEYAHVLLFEKADMTAEFKDTFWTTADLKHEAAAKSASDRNRFSVLRQYYEDNKNRFVSDYATMNSDEDMAETFVSFVRESKPTGNTIRDKKILFFYQYKDFVSLRTELRTNLAEQNVLY